MKKVTYILGGSLLALGAVAVLNACKTIPKGVTAVKPFNAEMYLGKWYEIARLDYRFEKNMNNTSAYYSLKEDGSIKVENSGYNYKKQQWEEATGKAKFVDSPKEGKLKVSFFGPFYSGYNVVDIDEYYRYVLVAGKNHHYLWLMAREKTMPEEVKQRFLQKARKLGYDTDKLVWVEQN